VQPLQSSRLRLRPKVKRAIVRSPGLLKLLTSTADLCTRALRHNPLMLWCLRALAFMVCWPTRRRNGLREIGIRIALGSLRLGVSGLVLADVLRLANLGIAIAIHCLCSSRKCYVASLFGVSTSDPLTLIVSSAADCRGRAYDYPSDRVDNNT